MKIAIVGESFAGKTTLLKILTNNNFSRSSNYFSGVGTFVLEDPNLDYLFELYNSGKKTPMHVEVFDFDGLGKLWKDEKRGEIKNELSDFDALICVISDFQETTLENSFYNLEYKLLLTDLDFVERRIESLKRERIKKKINEDEIVLLEKVDSWLSNEKPLHSLDLSEKERDLIRGYVFLSILPQIFVINREESRIGEELPSELLIKIEERNSPYFVTSLKVEEELMGLEGDEKIEILKEFGIKDDIKTAISGVVKDVLELTFFYTAGKTEARVWAVRKGATAKEAAGKIHSDMERGFIRAEVINIDDLKKAGSEKKAKELGLYRLEGKDYIVKDGDILHIRFSV
ncbi:MAG: DUF933 domain-containing protein [bacterium]|nr:DUF933 domain-containing protein [bacterium]